MPEEAPASLNLEPNVTEDKSDSDCDGHSIDDAEVVDIALPVGDAAVISPPDEKLSTSDQEDANQPDPSPNKDDGKPAEESGTPYCAFPEHEKRILMVIASFAGAISPFSSGIYYPAVDTLSQAFGVSVSLINLTISTYLIFQGIAPSFTAAFSEAYGRRPAYLICFIIYMASCLGLALAPSYAALLVLRCVQSSGSSGTIALGGGVISDLSTRAERGKYNAYINMGTTLGPSLAPVIGGLLSQYLGWRAIFWFLFILSAVFSLAVALGLRETNRTVVGNGSIPPPTWNRSVVQVIRDRLGRRSPAEADMSTLEKKKGGFNPLTSVLVLRDKENFFVILYASIQFAGYITVTSILASQLHVRYHLNEVDLGLCYLPLGLGALTSRWTVGYLVDWNFRRQAKIQGLSVVKNRQQNISKFNTEVARLQVGLPFTFVAGGFVLAYGWMMEYVVPLPSVLVILFFLGNTVAGSFVCIGTLVVDINRDRPASAAAAANLIRCTLAAGCVAAATPVINAIGIGWTSCIIVFTWAAFVPLLLLVYRHGHQWRMEKAAKAEEKARGDGAA